MTSHELAKKLLDMPDVMVTRNGYEGGVCEIDEIFEPRDLMLNENVAWYYGPHEYINDSNNQNNKPLVKAIHLS